MRVVADFVLGLAGGFGCMFVGWLLGRAELMRERGLRQAAELMRDTFEDSLIACRSKLAALRAVLGDGPTEVPE